jgi:unsaturated chondroitin disaccharide hydrolase
MRFVTFCVAILLSTSCRPTHRTSDGASQLDAAVTSDTWVREQLDFAVQQYKYFLREIGPNSSTFPRSLSDKGDLVLVPDKDWTSGFFPGGLWYLYEYSKDAELLAAAQHFTQLLEKQSVVTDNHDVGFIVMSSYGNAYRLTGNEAYKKTIVQTASSLSSRFNSKVGCTRSWDGGTWKFPVIIDNLMNIELLYWSSVQGNKPEFKTMANAHLDTTLKNHFREDGSSFHLVDYDPKTGGVLKRQTVQGYADNSAWARGQGWALYGYTMGYRFTKNPAYLQQAQRIAAFILTDPNMPQDFIPPWDFDAPEGFNAPRDTSAAAIYAAAFYELATYVDQAQRAHLIDTGDRILKSLSHAPYRATKVGELKGFLLGHAVGWMSGHSDVDQPLIYGDYYYLEALMRRLRLKQS